MANLEEFGLAQVDTGQIYLRHRPCGEIDFKRETKTAADVLSAANAHSCPEETPRGDIVEGSCT